MIFKPEMVEAILSGRKTVTRRPVKYVKQPHPDYVEYSLPCRYEVGRTYAVQPTIEEGPGKGRGGKEVARIRILSVREESIMRISGEGEAEKEGFDHAMVFISYWADLYGQAPDPFDFVHRIEFALVPPPTETGTE